MSPVTITDFNLSQTTGASLKDGTVVSRGILDIIDHFFFFDSLLSHLGRFFNNLISLALTVITNGSSIVFAGCSRDLIF